MPTVRIARFGWFPAFRLALASLTLLAHLPATPEPLGGQESAESFPQLNAFVFGDISYMTSERDVPEGFRIGQIVGHANVTLSDRVTVFGEVTATARPTGYALEVERVVLRYAVSDALKLSMGRYHTPNSYWNTAFHHGLWLQTSVGRPEPVRFGSLLLPTHFVGILAEGRVPLPRLGLHYGVGIGNGRGRNLARAGDAGDTNDDTAVTASLFARPLGPFGLQVGGSAYFDRASPDEGPDVSERILSFHVVWEGERPELLAEYAIGRHEGLASTSTTGSTDGGYVQVAYRPTGAASTVKPYIRGEWMTVEPTDPLLVDRVDDYRAWLAGIRWDVAPTAALKGEVRSERIGDARDAASFVLQASFAIPGLGGSGPALQRGTGVPLQRSRALLRQSAVLEGDRR